MRVSPTHYRRPVRGVLAAGLVMAVLLGACGASAPSQAELTEAFEVSGFSEELAECASAALVDNLSDDELVLLLERGGGGTPIDDPDDDGDSADKVRNALADCNQLQTPVTTIPIGGGVDEGGATIEGSDGAGSSTP